MFNTITWNGISSATLGLTVEKYPNMNRPARKFTVADVPGRNGSAYILQNAWSEVVQSYEISAKSPVASFKGVAEWLASANGYAVLQDSYDPTIYRMAVCVNPFEVETALNRAGRALIQFNCRPERYIANAQDIVVNSVASASIQNSTNHEAHPLLKIEGQGYPSMLPLTGRTDVMGSYSYYYFIEGLGAQKIRYNFIGLSDAYMADDYNIDKDASAISSYASLGSSVPFTATGATYGIGLNRSVKPNTTYTVSFNYPAASNTKNGKLSVITTDRDGYINAKVGSLEVTPSAGTKSLTFTTGAEAYWAVLIFLPTAAGSYEFQDVMMNLGGEAQPYAPYSDSTASAFTFGDCIIRLGELADYMYLDTETMNAYRGAGENLNTAVTITDLNGNLTAKTPRLVPGATLADLTGSDVNWITKLTITPRFWTL